MDTTPHLSILLKLPTMELVTWPGGPIGLLWQPGDGHRYLSSWTRLEGRLAAEASGNGHNHAAWQCTYFHPCIHPRTIITSESPKGGDILDPHYVAEKLGLGYNAGRIVAAQLNIGLPHLCTSYGLELLEAAREYMPEASGFMLPEIPNIELTDADLERWPELLASPEVPE